MLVTADIVEWAPRLGQLNNWSALALALFFAAAGFIVFPRTPFIIAAGAAFGLVAAPIILLGGTAGSIAAFLLSRHLAAEKFQRWLEQHRRLRLVARAVDLEGWRIIALLRLGGPIPNAATNYMLGLTRIDLAPYAFATLIFSMPQITLFCFLGATGRASLLDGSRLGTCLVSAALAVILIGLISWRVRFLLRKSLQSPR